MADKKSGGLVPLCNGTVITWTMPPLIFGFLVTGSIAELILQLNNIVLDVLIYMPFMSALNKRQLMEENKAK
ncbi:PTS cellobiose transporter subunit IIC [Lactobacillus amylovorus]|uniref:PTS cellobiose transporter subunit IIC n=1 Tax=Lactobacillus amylovorus TaxID=1604 RepID=UPI00233136FA|nr:PTS cellobiose transporter subunit IIC [Lactobacillus amylovorus]MDB6238317.1 PTS cellobiose transporter subunit IIC [Lactobacillus amylovorus]